MNLKDKMQKDEEIKALIRKVSDFGKKHEMEDVTILLMLDEINEMLGELKAHPSYSEGVQELRNALEDESF